MFPFETIRRIKAGDIVGCDITVGRGMEEYSGWGWVAHLKWISELSGLSLVALIALVSQGWLVMTDEEVGAVWLVPNDHFNSMARLVYNEYAD
jgi:hypothetical protein